MPRSYFNIQQYEKEILEMKKQGLFCSEIAKRLGLTKSQIRGFLARYEKIKEGRSLVSFRIKRANHLFRIRTKI